MSIRRRALLRACCALIAAIACVIAGATRAAGPATAAAGVAAPVSDPFYTPTGEWQDAPPGTVIRSRPVTIAVAGAVPALPATQILYRTENQNGGADATVATLIRPLVGTGPIKLLSYQTFYDGLASTCRPSYTLRGGDPANGGATLDATLMLDYVAQGYTVVTSDYEGSTDAYGAGLQSGRATLDAIRAAEHLLGLEGPRTPVALVGYSGGSIASMWAAQMQPNYAPDLDLIGVAAAGIPTDFWHNLAYIDGSSDWAGAIPAVATGLARAYGLNLDHYLNAKGEQIVAAVAQGCLNPSAYAGLTLASMLKPQFQDYTKVPALINLFNGSIMGRNATPHGPLLLGVGDADGTGDGVMVAKDVQQLAYKYCQQGVSVQFHVYSGANHDTAAPLFEAQAVPFVGGLYRGQEPADGCSSITPGNPMKPVRAPKPKKPKPKTSTPGHPKAKPK